MNEVTDPKLMTIDQVRSWAKGAEPMLVLRHIEWRLVQGASPAAINDTAQLVTDLRARLEGGADEKQVS